MESTVPGIASLVLLGISQISSVTVLNFSPVFPPTFLELGRGEERGSWIIAKMLGKVLTFLAPPRLHSNACLWSSREFRHR